MNNMHNKELNELRDRAYENAVKHGFHESNMSDDEMKMLIITEIAEAVQADRRNLHARLEKFENNIKNCRVCLGLVPEITPKEGFDTHFEELIKDTVEDELADVMIRLLDYAELKGYELYIFEAIVVGNTLCSMMFDLSRTITSYSTYVCVNVPFNKLIKICRLLNIDIWKFVALKMMYNENRPYKHGRKY